MTQKEIARALNVSVATVSLALNDAPRISPEMKEKVSKMAALGNYRPNLAAQGLLLGKTFTVGVILPAFSNPFYADLAVRIHRYLNKRNYVGLFFPTENWDEYREAVETLLRRKVDGLISQPLPPEEAVKIKGLFTTVFYGMQEIPTDYVAVDHYKGVGLAVKHLIGLGHTKIGFIGMQRPNEKRFAAYKDTLSKHKLVFKKQWVIPGMSWRETGYDGMRRILSLRNRPTAVVTHNDIVAIGAMRALAEAGLRVPEDMAVVGFDNIEDARYLPVGLTTVDQPRDDIARYLVEMLLSRIESKNGGLPRAKLIAPHLIVRESCGHKHRRTS